MNALWSQICLVVLGFTQFASTGFPQIQTVTTDASEATVQAVAMRDLADFLNKIPPGRETMYGFKNREEFLQASLGTPVRLFTIPSDSMRNGIDAKKSHVIPQNEWRVPIIIDGEFRSLLTVSMVNNVLKTVELGGELLAKELMDFWKREPKGRKALLRLYHLRCDFLVYDRNGAGIENGEYYPFHSARLIFDNLKCDALTPCSKADIYPKIQKKFAEEQWINH
jgi:hypothetical protein